MLGVNSRAKRGVMQHFVHVQTNASVDSSELLQSYWNADSSSLAVAGPSCHADSPLCYGVRSRPPLSVSRRQLLSASFVQSTLFSRPVTTYGPAEISSPKTLCLVSRQNRQRNRLLGGPPTQCYIIFKSETKQDTQLLLEVTHSYMGPMSIETPYIISSNVITDNYNYYIIMMILLRILHKI